MNFSVPPLRASSEKTFNEHVLNHESNTWKLSPNFVFKYHMHTVIFIIFVVLIGKLTTSSGLTQYLRKYGDSVFIANDKHRKPPSATPQNIKQNLRWK